MIKYLIKSKHNKSVVHNGLVLESVFIKVIEPVTSPSSICV